MVPRPWGRQETVTTDTRMAAGAGLGSKASWVLDSGPLSPPQTGVCRSTSPAPGLAWHCLSPGDPPSSGVLLELGVAQPKTPKLPFAACLPCVCLLS